MDSSGNIYLTGWTESFGAGLSDMVLVKLASKPSPSDNTVMIVLIVVLIASVLGVVIAITFFIRKRPK